ncbi:MAG: hypothetical protein L0I10_09980 [Bifidobacterium crudilactis]|uniref:hypothetical protein n=1 Tax=Bifidobacterium crudilactis TaxID=327277 RepID=UPI002647FC7A|nr:hypothetical protein [Bifidobacterium crudilactis]MDN5973376.1 hypothetical protein [Bifidobacterium crudilactis]
MTTSTLLPFFVVKLVYSFKDQVPAWRHMIIIVLECVIIGVVLPVLANLSNSFIIKHDFSDYYDARLKRPTVEEYKELNLDSEFRSKIFGRYGISFAALPSSLMATFSIFISPYSFLHARGTQGALTWVENFFFWAAFISLAAIVILVLTYLCIIPLIKIIRKR